MLAFFNISAVELLILVVLGGLCFAATTGIVVLLVWLNRDRTPPRND